MMVGIGVDDRRIGSFEAWGDVCTVFLGRMGMAKTYTPREGAWFGEGYGTLVEAARIRYHCDPPRWRIEKLGESDRQDVFCLGD